MKTNKKSLGLYGAAAVLLVPFVIGIGLLTADSVAEIMQKRRLKNGVQIMATVTDRKSSFNVVRGGGLNSYTIDYEFQYTDRQTGQLEKQAHADYPVYKKEYGTYPPGSRFTASFIPGDAAVNEPAATVGRFSPQTVLLAKILTGILAAGLVFGLLVSKLSRVYERFEGLKKGVVNGVILVAAFVMGSIVGGSVAHFLERLLLG